MGLLNFISAVIDRTTPFVVAGKYDWLRDAATAGGTLIPPRGTAFPSSPVADELFYRTDLAELYVRNTANTSWDQVGGSGSGLNTKSGVLIPGNFSGNPKVASVTFTSAYATTDYAVTLAPDVANGKTFAPAYVNKATAGFDVNLNANNIADLVEIGWHTIEVGE